jgi:hypothetical protein
MLVINILTLFLLDFILEYLVLLCLNLYLICTSDFEVQIL